MKTKFLKPVLLATLLISTNGVLRAQDDTDGCKDHPFFNRMTGFYLSKCEESYNQTEIVTGVDKNETLEGTVTNYEYYIMDNAKPPSIFQILKNYENAILAKGGEKIYFKARHPGEGAVGATYKMRSENNLYWVTFTYFNGSETQCDGYFMSVVKLEDMKQEIEANAMFDKVNAGESLTLYINFETGKSAIKDESLNIVDELYKMLSNNPALKIIVEGHTDNAGNPSSNKSLSEKRAESIKTALVNKGISADRIKTVGYGQDKPIGDNSTETGKAKNRRVEIKKQ